MAFFPVPQIGAGDRKEEARQPCGNPLASNTGKGEWLLSFPAVPMSWCEQGKKLPPYGYDLLVQDIE
jgi:hypothetical protein